MPSLEVLLRAQRWDEARNKLKRYKYKGVDCEYPDVVCSGEDIPDDVLETLFSKSPFPLRHITGNWPGNDAVGFCDGCLNWSVSYLERFLRLLLKTATDGEPIDNPRRCIKVIANEFTSTLIESLSSISSVDDLTSVANGRVGILWKRVELLLRASIRGGLDDHNTPLQELPLLAKMIQTKVPKLLIWLVLKLWPEQARIPDNEEYGRLPLHWAAYANDEIVTEGGVDIQYTDNTKILQEELEQQSLIDMLMKVYPEGASVPDKKKGSYPLELLLDNDNCNDSRYWTKEWTHRNVMQLARQNPENLVRICPINRLMPFMTASYMYSREIFFEECDNPDDRRDFQLAKLNLTYSLLMENPNAIMSGITSTDREAWLTDKLDKAQKHIQLLEGKITELRKAEAENIELRKQLLAFQQQQQQQMNSTESSLSLSGAPAATTTTTAAVSSTAASNFQIYTNIEEASLPPRKRKRSVMDRKEADEYM